MTSQITSQANPQAFLNGVGVLWLGTWRPPKAAPPECGSPEARLSGIHSSLPLHSPSGLTCNPARCR